MTYPSCCILNQSDDPTRTVFIARSILSSPQKNYRAWKLSKPEIESRCICEILGVTGLLDHREFRLPRFLVYSEAGSSNKMNTIQSFRLQITSLHLFEITEYKRYKTLNSVTVWLDRNKYETFKARTEMIIKRTTVSKVASQN